jgi:hypothetical protein
MYSSLKLKNIIMITNTELQTINTVMNQIGGLIITANS